MYSRLNRKQQTVVTESSVRRRQRRICQWRKKTVNVLKKAGKCDFKLTTIERQCRWNHERTEPYLESTTATKAEERQRISLWKRPRTKLFWKEQLKPNTDDVVPRRTVATVQEGFVLKRTVNEADGEDFVLKRTVVHSRRLLAEKNAIQTERASPRGEDLRCRTWKKRGLYRPVSLICGSKCTNQKRAPKAPFFCPFWPYCVSFLQRNWARVYKVAPLEEKNISTCCPRCQLPDYILCWSICVNNNKLLTVNTKKTTVGSKFTRICMGNVSFYNSSSFQHGVVKLCGWHVDNVGNIVKTRFLLLRMPGVIAF